MELWNNYHWIQYLLNQQHHNWLNYKVTDCTNYNNNGTIWNTFQIVDEFRFGQTNQISVVLDNYFI